MSLSKIYQVIIAVLQVLVLFLFVWQLILLFWPYPEWQAFKQKPYSIIVVDRTGRELQVLPLAQGQRRLYASLAQMPDFVPRIFITSEDRRFYLHAGVDPLATARALYQNVSQGKVVSGASTISMQLARIISPHPATLTGKFKEMFDALRLEARMPKEKLLELWLNSIPFGFNTVGVSAATRTFFGVPLSKLTQAQACILAVIPRSPEKYNPLKAAEQLKESALRISNNLDFPVSEQAIALAMNRVRQVNLNYKWPFYAPHFIELVKEQLKAEDYLCGQTIYTTLDLDIQHELQGNIQLRVQGAQENRISNGAGLLIENTTGQILAYVGSRSFFDKVHSGQIDGVRIERQPGSALKPYLYALALEKGFTAASILPDIPMEFGNEEIYIPRNFNMRFNGPVRLRTALASSLNVPSVYLLYRLGVNNFLDILRKLGFNSITRQETEVGLGLALGNAEVSLWELVRAFSVFPRQGFALDLFWRLDHEKPVIPKGKQVFKKQTTQLIIDILSRNEDRVLGFGRDNVLNTEFDSIIKTGTSNQFNNIWAIGATPDKTCGVWMGNFSGQTVIGRPGSSLPALVVVETLEQFTEDGEFPSVSELIPLQICPLSGELATAACPSSMTEYFIDPPALDYCSYHQMEQNQLVTCYPSQYRNWAQQRGYRYSQVEDTTELCFTSPQDGAIFFYDPTIPPKEQAINIEVDGAGFAELFVNQNNVAQGDLPLAWFLPVQRGIYWLEARTAKLEQKIYIEVR